MKKIALLIAIIFAVGIVNPAFAENTASTGVAAKKTVASVQEKYANVQAQYLAAKQQYQAAKENYTAAKKEWDSARITYIEKRNSTNATVTLIEKGKEYLTRTVDNRIKHFELVKRKVENMSVLSDAEKSSIVAELNANIATFEGFKAEISAVTTKEGLKAVAVKIKDAWTTSQRGVERAAGHVLAAKEAKLAELALNVSAQAKTRLEKLKASGKDTSAYDAILSEFDAKIAAAKVDIDAAKAKFEAAGSASTAAEKKTLIAEGKELLKQAHEKIKEAHKILKEGIKNMRENVKEAASRIKEARKENKSASNSE